MSTSSTSAAPAQSWRARLSGAAAFRAESVLVLAALIVVMSVAAWPYFLSVSNALNILLATSTIGVLAIGMTFVISSAGIDLSVGSIMAFAGVVGSLCVNALGLPWPFGIVGCIVAGALAGRDQRLRHHPRRHPAVHRHARHAGRRARRRAGADQRRAGLRPAGADRLSRPGPPVRRAGAGDPAAAHRARRACAAVAHPLRSLCAGDRRQRGRGAGDGRPRAAPQMGALHACPAVSPASPA